jgi:hypothetical protein
MESTTPGSGTTGAPGVATGAAGNGRLPIPAPGTRSAAEIRRDIVAQRGELSRSVDALRTRWVAATDLSAQFKKHKPEILVGAAVVGFLVGGAIAFGRRRR